MKNIQECLGHSNFSTTADVYSHLDYTTKYESANAINQALTQNKEEKLLEEEKAKSRGKLENETSRLQELIKEQEEQERIEKEREEKRKQKIREQAEM